MALHVETPLIPSTALGKTASCKVWLKLENCQPVASFKIRGIGALCVESKKAGKSRIVSSSGGNAGLAAAYSSKVLEMPCKIFVPGSTSESIINLLRAEGAEVQVAGRIWDEANEEAQKFLQSSPDSAFVHPFDNPIIWTGNSTVIHEIKAQIGDVTPGCIVASVGGGGLLTGIVEGLDAVGWSDVPVVAMETDGAASFSASVIAGELVTIPDITSIAKTLGSRRVCKQLFEYTKDHNIISQVVSDNAAVDACLRFVDDHRMLVEPSCGATLAAVYSGVLQQLQRNGRLPAALDNIVMIVCGGSGITLDVINSYKTMFPLDK